MKFLYKLPFHRFAQCNIIGDNMEKKNQILYSRINAFTDGIFVVLIYLLATWVWLDLADHSSSNMANIANYEGYAIIVLFAYACWTVLVLTLFGAYQPNRTHGKNWRYGVLVLGNTFAVIVAATALYLFRLEEFSRGVLGLYYIFSSSALVMKRMLARFIMARLQTNVRHQKHVLVIGGGKLAEQYIQSVSENQGLGLCIDKHLIPGDTLFEDLESALHNNEIAEVVLALNIDELHITNSVIHACEKSGTKISVIPFYNDFIPSNPTVDTVGNVKLIRLRTTPLDLPFNAFCKRSFDLLGSAVLLLLLSPAFLIIALLTKLSSPGPVIFRQERVGLNKKTFTMYKFRSMRENTEQNSAWSTNNDSRRTFIGSLLRKTSLDELPQLWNVLKGDMSLVGPRPEIPFYVDRFRETVPLYMVKYQVRPGMTGWAQINGLRGNTSIPDRIRHDLWYIEHWSIELDIKILFKTAFGGMLNKEEINFQDTAAK